jgi:glycosyltransferase involved in cell wall biosynthesis
MQPILKGASSPLRVAIVAPTLGILGGHAVQAQSMLAGWRGDPAVDAWLVPINPTPSGWLRRCLRVKYVRTVATQLCYWPLLARELRRADVAHVFSASSSGFLLSTVPAVVVAKALGTPVLLNYHSGEAHAHLSGSALARLVLRRGADLHVVPSTFLREVFRRFGLSARVVANTIDLGRFGYRVRDPLRPRLLSTRNFEPVYNVACTLRAFARVQAAIPDATLTVVGDGSGREDLQALARSLDLRHVTFVGRVPPSEMPAFYAAADIYVQTPVADNMPVSVLEAFASGVPVVSTDVGGVSSVLTDGVHGLLARDNDPGHVSEQILHLLDHADEARRLASTARDSCRAFEWANVRDAWLAAYHTAARPRPGHAVSIEAA